MSKRDYSFNKTISQEVLRNYLSRSIVLSYLDWTAEGETHEKTAADCRDLIIDTGAKYIARAGCAWIPNISERARYNAYKQQISAVHEKDPDVVFEACIFETAYDSFNEFEVPEFVFEAFGLPYEKRNFRCEKMLYTDGRYVDHWEKGGHVPDITQLESQMFFFWRGCLYIELGFEALHYGQVMLMGETDTDFACWSRVMQLVREYAKDHARRGIILFNAHTHGIIGTDGKLLFDFHCYPCRPVAVSSDPPHIATEQNPQRAELISGWGNSIYNRSMGGTTYSGWSCDSLPYFVEIDNYGCQPPELLNTHVDYYPWGYDESSWFANQPKSYRKEWIKYACNWLAENDSNGYLEMLGIRTARLYDESLAEKLTRGKFYYVNSKEFDDRDIIKEVWKD